MPMTGSGPVPSAPAPDDLRDATVVLTGVGRPGQVGEVVASAFASQGATLMLVDRDGDAVSARANDLKGNGASAHAFGCDLTSPDDVARLSEKISALATSGVAAVVHMAGGYVDGDPVADTEPSAWHKMFAINLTTAFMSTRALLPLVRKARGTMVYFASAAALPGASVSNSAAYSAAKGGVVTLMRAVAAEERKNGVRSNALAPQPIRTEQNISSMGLDHQYVERETVAAWVLWLCSSAAGPVTGQVIRIG